MTNAAANDNSSEHPAVGTMYRATEHETTTQIAARIRAWIKAEVKAGRLPAAKYTVRTRYASMMAAIDVCADDLPFCVWQLSDSTYAGERLISATEAAEAVRDALQEQLDLYNDRRSDRHPRYFGRAELGHSDERNGLYEFSQLVQYGALDRALPASSLEVA